MHSIEQQEKIKLDALNFRCTETLRATYAAITYTHQRVQRALDRVTIARARGMGIGVLVLRPGPAPVRLIDATVFDSAEDAAMLNEVAEVCSRCGRSTSLVALIRFESLGVDLAVCGDCYQDLSDRALGQVV